MCITNSYVPAAAVSIAAGQTVGSFPINTLRVTNDTNVSITAGATSASLVVRAGP